MHSVGCLLIGNSGGGPERFSGPLAALGIRTVSRCWQGDLLSDMQRGLFEAQRNAHRTCVLAEGGMWAAALALGVQLDVDRIVLIHPGKGCVGLDEGRRRQLERLKAYARRNLFICVSDVLILESSECAAAERIDPFARLVNARVWRMKACAAEDAWSAVSEFLLCEDFQKSAHVCQ